MGMVIRLNQYALLYVAKQPERSSAVSISFRLSLCRSLLETVLGSRSSFIYFATLRKLVYHILLLF